MFFVLVLVVTFISLCTCVCFSDSHGVAGLWPPQGFVAICSSPRLLRVSNLQDTSASISTFLQFWRHRYKLLFISADADIVLLFIFIGAFRSSSIFETQFSTHRFSFENVNYLFFPSVALEQVLKFVEFQTFTCSFWKHKIRISTQQ